MARITSKTILTPMRIMGLVVVMSFSLVIVYKFSKHLTAEKQKELKNDVQQRLIKEFDLSQKEIEQTFAITYDALRTMASLPGVRSIDRYAQGFEGDSKFAVQELYNNIASRFSISEIYIVPADMDPDKIDLATNKMQTPIATFDHIIVGKRGDDAPVQGGSKLEEVEIYEYRQMKSQLAYFKEHFPSRDSFPSMDFPAISSQEIITCDNSEFTQKDFDSLHDAPRKGIVYSVPFYAPDGQFKGIVSAVIRSVVMSRLLKEEFLALYHEKQHFTVFSASMTPPIREAMSLYLAGQLNETMGFEYKKEVSVKDVFKWRLQALVLNNYPDFVRLHKQVNVFFFSVLSFGILIDILFFSLVFMVLFLYENLRLEKDRLKAESASLAKSQFLANMSHEIRTPLNAIIGFSNILHTTALDEKQKNYLNTIISSGDMLLSIINDILDFSKLEAGGVKLEDIDFNLEYLVYDIFKIVKVRFQGQHIDSYIDWDAQVPRWVKGDPTRVRQILLNLLGNAAKFTSKGGIGLIVQLQEDNQDTAVIRFSVKDTGIGIPADKIQTLFTEFTQVDNSTTRKYGGTGLGLAICKRLVSAMGGRIWIESKLNEGSEFNFTIPFKRGESLLDKPIQMIALRDLAGVRVFCVDDNQASLDIIKKYCQDKNINVVDTALSGKEALEKLEQLYAQGVLPQVILSDVMMPQMDGYGLVSRLKADVRLKDIKAIAVTSDLRMGVAKIAQENGFNAFLPKPINREDLVQIIAVVLGDHRGSPSPILTRHTIKEIGLKGLKVLVTDDSVPNQELMRAYLNMFGCVGDFANNGLEAIEKARLNPYDIILMDLQMPQMGGDEATMVIRREVNKEVPIIALTAAVMKEDQEKCMASGMNDFITKPIDINRLKEIIVKWSGRT